MEDVGLPIIICGMLFIGLPWLVFHYVTQWKKSGSLSLEDEKLLDDLHETARRLDDRLGTIERIMTAENPGWRQLSADTASLGIDDRNTQSRNTQGLRRIDQ